MNKEMMYTTGQIASLCGVSVRTLQYYDNEGLVKATRSNSRRLYSRADIQVLHRILFYKELGFTIEAIRDRIKDDSSSSQLRFFDKQLHFIELEYLQVRSKRAATLAIKDVLKVIPKAHIPESIIADLIKTNKTIERYSDIDFEVSPSVKDELSEKNDEITTIYFEWKRLSIEALILIENNISYSVGLGERWKSFITKSLKISSFDEHVFGAFRNQSSKWPVGDSKLFDDTKTYLEYCREKFEMEIK